MTDTTSKRERPATAKKAATAKTAAAAPAASPTTNGAREPQEASTGAAWPGGDPFRALRAPFDPEAVGKLPKGTCKACRDLARNYRACESHSWVRACGECGNSHSSATIHLDYVGHADLTQRLLEVDPLWTWEPFSVEQISALPPALRDAGLWINLTVLGVTRPGFGDAQGKTGPNAVKEMVGDALRNAGMRFGIALDLWAKGDRNWAKAPDETPEGQVADPGAAPQTEGQQALESSSRHTRGAVLDDMPVDQMPQQDRRRWHTHMATLTDDLRGLSPDQVAFVQGNWPDDMPTPKSGRMTITQIKDARAFIASVKSQAAQQQAPTEPEPDPTLPSEDEPPF